MRWMLCGRTCKSIPECWSWKPETWNTGGLPTVAMILGVLMIGESIGLSFIGTGYLGLAGDIEAVNTFGFELMIYFAILSLFVTRERRHFWDSRPSQTLFATLLLDAILAAVVATIGIPGTKPIPLTVIVFVIGYAFVFSLCVNDVVKFVLAKRLRISW